MSRIQNRVRYVLCREESSYPLAGSLEIVPHKYVRFFLRIPKQVLGNSMMMKKHVHCFDLCTITARTIAANILAVCDAVDIQAAMEGKK
jgi:hypothetical protein